MERICGWEAYFATAGNNILTLKWDGSASYKQARDSGSRR